MFLRACVGHLWHSENSAAGGTGIIFSQPSIAFVDTDTGEFGETRLQHREQAEKFYREPAMRAVQVRVVMEASGQARFFERRLAELKMELWIGDAAGMRAPRVRKKKTDREDARHILRLLVEDRFPRIWVPS